MIKSLSPYYVTIPFVSPLSGLTCTEYTLDVYVWNGNKNTPPIAPVYTFTKSNPSLSNGNDLIDISNIINDFINFTPKVNNSTDLLDGDNQNWVLWQTYYKTSTPEDLTNPTNVNLELMTKGFGYGMEGQNPQLPTNKILLSGTEFKVNRNGTFVLPILIDESELPESSFILNSVTALEGDFYNYNTTISDFNGNISLFYRQNGDTEWITSERYYSITDGTYDFESLEITLTGDVDFCVGLFFPITASYIYSNVITLSI